MHESAHHRVVASTDVGEDAAEEGRAGGVVQDRRQGGRQRRDQPLGKRIVRHDLLQGTCMQATRRACQASCSPCRHNCPETGKAMHPIYPFRHSTVGALSGVLDLNRGIYIPQNSSAICHLAVYSIFSLSERLLIVASVPMAEPCIFQQSPSRSRTLYLVPGCSGTWTALGWASAAAGSPRC